MFVDNRQSKHDISSLPRQPSKFPLQKGWKIQDIIRRVSNLTRQGIQMTLLGNVIVSIQLINVVCSKTRTGRFTE